MIGLRADELYALLNDTPPGLPGTIRFPDQLSGHRRRADSPASSRNPYIPVRVFGPAFPRVHPPAHCRRASIYPGSTGDNMNIGVEFSALAFPLYLARFRVWNLCRGLSANGPRRLFVRILAAVLGGIVTVTKP